MFSLDFIRCNCHLLRVLRVSVLALLLGGTLQAADDRYQNVDHILPDSKPSVTIRAERGIEISDYQTFSEHPNSQKDLSQMMRSAMEEKGYRYVSEAEEADLLVSIEAKSVYREVEVPEEIYEVYHPPGTYHPYYHGRPYDPDAEYYYYGYYSKVVRPGYIECYYEPQVSITIYDGKREVWHAFGNSITDTEDVKISSQYVIWKIMEHLPQQDAPSLSESVVRRHGFEYAVFSNDGEAYFPILTVVHKGTPAREEGLRRADRIIQINGQTVEGMHYRRIAEMLMQPGEIQLLIHNGSDMVAVSLGQ